MLNRKSATRTENAEYNSVVFSLVPSNMDLNVWRNLPPPQFGLNNDNGQPFKYATENEYKCGDR